MKLFTACLVLAAFAAAESPVRSDPLVTTSLSFISDRSTPFERTLAHIKAIELRNFEVLSSVLYDISSELHQGLDSDLIKINNGIHKTLVDIQLKIAESSRIVISIQSQIVWVADTISTLHADNAKSNYNIQQYRVKKLFKDTLAMTSVVLQLIDETREMVGKGVSGPLKMLQLTILLTSDNRLVRERANIQLQRSIITNPPRKGLFFTDYEAVNTAETLKRASESTVNRIENFVRMIVLHVRWLEHKCHIIREELDKERTDIMEWQYRKIEVANKTVNTLTSIIDSLYEDMPADSQNTNDEIFREGSKHLVQVMKQLREDPITRNRIRRAAEPYYESAMEPH